MSYLWLSCVLAWLEFLSRSFRQHRHLTRGPTPHGKVTPRGRRAVPSWNFSLFWLLQQGATTKIPQSSPLAPPPAPPASPTVPAARVGEEIGRASCRERV